MVDKKALREMGNKVLKAGREALPYLIKVPLAVGEFIASPLMFPTYFRRYEKFVKDLGDSEESSLIIPYWFMTTIVGNGICTGAGIISDSKYFLYPAAFISTNVISGIYEWYKHESEKNKLPSTTSSAGSPTNVSSSSGKLEEKVEKNEIKIKDIPNPWDIEIPKIEDKKIRGRY